MDTAVIGIRPTESVFANPGGCRWPSRPEAEAAVRTLIEWTGDDPDREVHTGTSRRAMRGCEEFFTMIGSPGSGSHDS